MHLHQTGTYRLHSTRRRKGMRLLAGRSQGQAIVLIAVMMVVVLAFVALAVDGGELYLLRRKAQNAADAAVIAAVYELCKNPYEPDASRAGDATQAAIGAAADNDFIIDAGDVTFPDAPASVNHILITVTAQKDPKLIQVVYNGPLAVSAYAEGTCTPATIKTTGMAMVGIGACSDLNKASGQNGISYSGSNFTLTGGFSTNGTAYFGGGTAKVDACPTEAQVGDACFSSPAGTTGGGTSPAVNASGVTYLASPPTTNPTGTKYPAFWSIGDFQPGGNIYAVAQELGVYHTAWHTPVNDWHDFGFNSDGSNLTPGIYYVPGNVAINSPSNLKNAKLSGVTLVATGSINLNLGGSNTNIWSLYQFPKQYPSDTASHSKGDETGMGPIPVIFTPTGDGSCNGSKSGDPISSTGAFNFMGVIYGPNGKCDLQFDQGGSTDGAIICGQVDASGANYSINYNPMLMPPWDPNGGIAH